MGKEGFAGGYFYDRMEMQNALSSALKQIFAGEDARNIPFTYSKKSYPFINYQQLQMDGRTPHSVLRTRYSSINRLHSGRSIMVDYLRSSVDTLTTYHSFSHLSVPAKENHLAKCP